MRKSIPKKLCLQVEFASDRTCCICRIAGKSIQIAHIDDNPINNSFDNLAILCLEHHDEAHRKGGLGRNLTPEIVRLYNQTWRELVKGRLLPDDDVRHLREYQQEVMLEISLVCQGWVNTFIAHTEKPGAFLFEKEKRTLSYLAENSTYPYSEEMWTKLHPLASEHLKPITKQLEHVMLLHSQVIPVHLKTMLLRSLRQFANFSSTYVFILLAGKLAEDTPEWLAEGMAGQEKKQTISFGMVLQALKSLDDEASKVREVTAISS